MAILNSTDLIEILKRMPSTPVLVQSDKDRKRYKNIEKVEIADLPPTKNAMSLIRYLVIKI